MLQFLKWYKIHEYKTSTPLAVAGKSFPSDNKTFSTAINI